ncbi:class I SAM-dependent methyltransferase [Paenibacillus doosanensis]|uniref:class I SAM-dependent methyltransferase n=1 Tax=Paenibacillus doosanensis TaxID=1229154 RepID=UPI0021803BD2|nr:class I SAM-dependent methyltransferase [Paenibacillus doosanensis]MCS7461929.1 class I SAM-dependent methyltransferase [Paenibacillus doosanensis]
MTTEKNLEQEREIDWPQILSLLDRQFDAVAASAHRTLSDRESLSLLMWLVTGIARYGFLTHERKMAIFDKAEQLGVHMMPVHFYSPVPPKNELTPRDFAKYDACGIDLNAGEQFSRLESMAPFLSELADIPYDPPASEHQYYYNNSAFCGIDASVYYAMIRQAQPARVIEVGAGFSTLMAASAIRKNGRGTLTAIEPYPSDVLQKGFEGLHRLIPSKVQDVDTALFESLEKNDILFIDNSHVSKIGSDVNHLLLRVLPRLRSGVIVHLHDLFIPYEYPEDWVKQLNLFWNEQYVAQALLTHSTKFEVWLAHYFLSQTDYDKLRALLPHSPHHIGSSFWIKVK